jgi:hypothetical protein
MFKDWIPAFDDLGLADWSVCAYFWILIDAVWTIDLAVTVDLLIE